MLAVCASRSQNLRCRPRVEGVLSRWQIYNHLAVRIANMLRDPDILDGPETKQTSRRVKKDKREDVPPHSSMPASLTGESWIAQFDDGARTTMLGIAAVAELTRASGQRRRHATADVAAASSGPASEGEMRGTLA